MLLHAWLKKYGLEAQSLTLLDALAPASVNLKPRYVRALGRHILSPTLLSQMPLCCLVPADLITDGQKQKELKGPPKILLLNPSAVELPSYMSRLQTALRCFER
ncbi:unnamed protein product [Protopolystoma xenopodis]|uniref:Uncharacterized protein n=1 Tax=Protopolystoma xenopodis TaxID=117903 RepID=A0A448WDY7_9PLAT|nr:unnamed protein product [Protopolystoma xenopodis]